MLIGYMRISTGEQNLDLQRDALERAGCERIYDDVCSGRATERPGLAKALDVARAPPLLDASAEWQMGLRHLGNKSSQTRRWREPPPLMAKWKPFFSNLVESSQKIPIPIPIRGGRIWANFGEQRSSESPATGADPREDKGPDLRKERDGGSTPLVLSRTSRPRLPHRQGMCCYLRLGFCELSGAAHEGEPDRIPLLGE
jgi:hypothetical protein